MENENVHNSFGKTTTSQSSSNRMLFGILSYIGILVVIPYLVAKDDSFVKFHVKQSLVLFSIEIVLWLILWFLANTIWVLYPLVNLLNLVMVLFSIIGIVNVVQNKEKSLPLVGQYSEYFKI